MRCGFKNGSSCRRIKNKSPGRATNTARAKDPDHEKQDKMKNTARIQRNGSTKPAAAQIQTPAIETGSKYQFGVFHELDCAKQQSAALHMLLFDALNKGEGTYSSEIQCGIIELMDCTHKRTNEVVKTVEKIFMQKAEVAA